MLKAQIIKQIHTLSFISKALFTRQITLWCNPMQQLSAQQGMAVMLLRCAPARRTAPGPPACSRRPAQ